MKHLGDITKIHDAPFVDCITFGSPCQGLSQAGLRLGLLDVRSGLFIEAVRIIKEMRVRSNGMYPTFAVWENVPGAFSSNRGEDFRAVLEELAKIEETGVSIPRPENGKWAKAGYIAGNGWSIAWRTLDAQYWGVPQRRKRIALVVDFGGQRAGEILFERTGMSGNLEPSIPPWKGVARNPAHSTAGYDRVVEEPGAYSIGNGQVNQLRLSNKARTLDCMHDPQAIIFESHSQDARYTQQGNTSPACTAQWGTGGNNMPLVAEKYAPDIAHTLRARPNCSFREDSKTFVAEKSLTPWDEQARRVYLENGSFPALSAREKAGQNQQTVLTKAFFRWIVRRLIPMECERLQGYPDGWTDIGEWVDSKGKRHKPSDGPRYKALGNSIALPQWWWLTCKMAAYLPEHATLGSLFDGIGGFPLVWETKHGKGTALWASEIEEFPIAVTKIRFKEN